MDARPGTDAAGRWPLGFLGMVALVLACECGVERLGLSALDGGSLQYRLAGTTAAREARGCDVLCFGDSLVKLGVLPRVIEERRGLRAFNLAAVGGQAPTSYYVFRRALEGRARPRAVLVDFFPNLLLYGPRFNAGNWPHLLTVRECLELGWRTRDPAFLGAIVLGRLLPSVRRRGPLRNEVVRVFTRGLNHWRYERTWLLYHWDRGRGAQVMHDSPQRAIDPGYWQRNAFPAAWECHPVNADYVGRFLALAERHGVTVYWLLPPKVASVQAECERAGFDARYVAFVRSWQERFPNLVVVDGRHADYDPDVFAIDPTHLGRAGAYVYSVALADLLDRPPPAASTSRWVTLPLYRTLPVGLDIEDDLMARQTALSRRATRR